MTGADTEPREAGERDLLLAGYRYALSLTHHPHDAEDLVQQACLRVYRRKGGLMNKSYLFTTIRNLFFDQRRRDALATFEALPPGGLTGQTQDPAARVEQDMDLETVLGALSSEERETLYLNCVEGFTTAEMVKLIGQPRGTILSRLSRCKKKLQQKFGPIDENESQPETNVNPPTQPQKPQSRYA
ncbi:MAG: RNA polymerase sigma factor [Planctomycetota bacterium]|jgi:RNA polymerase sigma-70 factor (ECF subfamily)